MNEYLGFWLQTLCNVLELATLGQTDEHLSDLLHNNRHLGRQIVKDSGDILRFLLRTKVMNQAFWKSHVDRWYLL